MFVKSTTGVLVSQVCIVHYNHSKCYLSLIGEGCDPNPCMNGGVCVSNADGSFDRCNCATGWTGTTCTVGKKKKQLINQFW